MTAINDKYVQLGGPAGWLGGPVTGEVPAAGGGLKQQFTNATIYWHARTGAFEVHGAIHACWQALGGEGSPFGYPTSDETPTSDGTGQFSNFEHASVYWHQSVGAFEVHGLIRDRWRALGGEMSLLGYPLTNETATPDGVGRYNHFQNGSIYWTPSTGAHEVYGPVRRRWAALRWERGLLGYPIAPPTRTMRNRAEYLVAPFQNGKIEVNTATHEVYVEKLATIDAPNYAVPIVAYRVSDTDGSRPCAITVDGVQQWVTEANRVYAAAGVQFVFDGVLRDLADTEVNNIRGEQDPTWSGVRDRLNQLAVQHRSVVVVHRAEIGGGFSSSTYDFVAMSFFDSVHRHALWLLGHELGHHFGLPHTFGPGFRTVREAEDYILSGRPPQAFDGDSGIIDDTPPDPMIDELNATTSVEAVTLADRAFSLARNNVMSYWIHNGIAELSHGQIDRVRQIVLERQGRYLDVTSMGHLLWKGDRLLTDEPHDRIVVSVEPDAATPGSVEFALETPDEITWRKELVLTSGNPADPGSWTLFTQDARHRDANGLWLHQLAGGHITLRRLDPWPGGMTDVRRIPDLEKARPNARVTFRWHQD